MQRDEALKVFDLMGNFGASSRGEAYGQILEAVEPELFISSGEKVDQARMRILSGYGNLLNKLGSMFDYEPKTMFLFPKSIEHGLRMQRHIILPKARGGTYPAKITIETNTKKIGVGARPTYQPGEALFINIESIEHQNPDDFIFEVVLDDKNGSVYINGGGEDTLDLGDYQVLEMLLEDID